jgi:3-oxoadipate enol-lactonase
VERPAAVSGDAVRVVDAGGVRLACRVTGEDGDAPAVVLLHSLGEDGSAWADTARRLAGRYRVYAPDLRGHGDSARAPEYSFRLMRDDVIALLDALGLDRVRLVGHSLGAVVAYLVAGERPERVDRLVLEDPPPPVPDDPPRTVTEDERRRPASFDWEAVAAIRRQRADPDTADWDLLTRITAPTLVVAGGNRSHLPQAEIARMARAIPRGRLVTIEAGHFVHRDRPAEFAALLEEFLP